MTTLTSRDAAGRHPRAPLHRWMTGSLHPSRTTARSTAPTISVRGVGKRYSGVTVLDGVDLDIVPGEVHGLVGENGAGKSTLLRILGGAIRADHGTLSFDGERRSIGTPRDAIREGVSLITQEGALVPSMTVLDNVFLSRWSHHFGIRRRRNDRIRFSELTERTGFSVDPARRVDELSLGAQQQVEILRCLARGANVLAFDEPTAVLAESEKVHLLELIRRLSREGTTIILVSHFLDEVLQVADRVTVLRDGRLVVTEQACALTPALLVRHMVGRDVGMDYAEPPPVADTAPVRLSARALRRGLVTDVDLTVRAGEILGIAGLVGSGRSETLRLLFGADRRAGGVVEVDGTALGHLTPAVAMRAGVAMVPESRKEQGLIMVRSVRENMALASLGSRCIGPFIRPTRERNAIVDVSTSVSANGARASARIANLSGGNQQKALLAKWLLRNPRVLLIDEPTRGVDIAAKVQIHQLILKLASEGLAVVIVSSEVEELLGLSHRVIVLRCGKAIGEFPRGTKKEEILAAAFGEQVAAS